MKTLIVLVLGLLAVGCATLTPEQKKLEALRDSVVGEYEWKSKDGNTYKKVFLDNGIEEYYINGKKQWELKWSIGGFTKIYRINTDKSITMIANIVSGKREDRPKEFQNTYKKIK